MQPGVHTGCATLQLYTSMSETSAAQEKQHTHVTCTPQSYQQPYCAQSGIHSLLRALYTPFLSYNTYVYISRHSLTKLQVVPRPYHPSHAALSSKLGFISISRRPAAVREAGDGSWTAHRRSSAKVLLDVMCWCLFDTSLSSLLQHHCLHEVFQLRDYRQGFVIIPRLVDMPLISTDQLLSAPEQCM